MNSSSGQHVGFATSGTFNSILLSKDEKAVCFPLKFFYVLEAAKNKISLFRIFFQVSNKE